MAVNSILLSKIFFVSLIIFNSSLVYPSSTNRSMWGIALKAICFVKFLEVIFLFSNESFVCSTNSSIGAFPAPDVDWYVEITTNLI